MLLHLVVFSLVTRVVAQVPRTSRQVDGLLWITEGTNQFFVSEDCPSDFGILLKPDRYGLEVEFHRNHKSEKFLLFEHDDFDLQKGFTSTIRSIHTLQSSNETTCRFVVAIGGDKQEMSIIVPMEQDSNDKGQEVTPASKNAGECSLPGGGSLKNGERQLSSDCSFECRCQMGLLVCVPRGCAENERCVSTRRRSFCSCKKGYLRDIRGCYKNCPEGFVPFRDHCYHYEATRLSFPVAEYYCREIGSYLTNIQSEEENTFVADLVGQVGFAWIGGRRGNQELYTAYSSANDSLAYYTQRIPRGLSHFEFSVSSEDNKEVIVFISSSEFETAKKEDTYEIVFGAFNNTRTILRRCRSCVPLVIENTPNVLNNTDDRRFYIKIENYLVKIGILGVQKPLLRFVDRHRVKPSLRYFGYESTSEAEWTFYRSFFWVSGEPWQYDNWRTTEPDLTGQGLDVCLMTNFDCLGTWNDESCMRQLPFVCKI